MVLRIHGMDVVKSDSHRVQNITSRWTSGRLWSIPYRGPKYNVPMDIGKVGVRFLGVQNTNVPMDIGKVGVRFSIGPKFDKFIVVC